MRARPIAAPAPGSRRDAARSRTVRFHHEDHVFEATLADTGVTLDVSATLAAMEAVGHKGSFSSRWRESERARKGLVELPLVWIVDDAKGRALLATFAASLEWLGQARPIPQV